MHSKNRSLIPILLTYFLDNFGLALIYPILTPLILNINADLFSTAPTLLSRLASLGILLGAFPVAQCLGSPLIGQFSDRYGRKRSFYMTILGTSLGYFLTGTALIYDSLPLKKIYAKLSKQLYTDTSGEQRL